MNWWIVMFYHKWRHCSYGGLRTQGETASEAVKNVRKCGGYPAAEYNTEVYGPFSEFPERRTITEESEG